MSVHDECRALLQRYARAVDTRDLDTLESLFHPEATIVGSRGSQNLQEWLDTMRGPRSFPASMHVIGEPLVEHGAGTQRAALDTYAVVYQLGAEPKGSGDLTLGVRYLDDLVLYDARWVIHQRDVTTLWMR